MSHAPTLHFLIYNHLPTQDEDAFLNETHDWLIENFGNRITTRRYAHSVSVLFEDLDQVFLARLKLHKQMNPV